MRPASACAPPKREKEKRQGGGTGKDKFVNRFRRVIQAHKSARRGNNPWRLELGTRERNTRVQRRRHGRRREKAAAVRQLIQKKKAMNKQQTKAPGLRDLVPHEAGIDDLTKRIWGCASTLQRKKAFPSPLSFRQQPQRARTAPHLIGCDCHAAQPTMPRQAVPIATPRLSRLVALGCSASRREARQRIRLGGYKRLGQIARKMQ